MHFFLWLLTSLTCMHIRWYCGRDVLKKKNTFISWKHFQLFGSQIGFKKNLLSTYRKNNCISVIQTSLWTWRLMNFPRANSSYHTKDVLIIVCHRAVPILILPFKDTLWVIVWVSRVQVACSNANSPSSPETAWKYFSIIYFKIKIILEINKPITKCKQGMSSSLPDVKLFVAVAQVCKLRNAFLSTEKSKCTTGTLSVSFRPRFQ